MFSPLSDAQYRATRTPRDDSRAADRFLGEQRRYTCQEIAKAVGGARVGMMAATELKRYKVGGFGCAGESFSFASSACIAITFSILDIKRSWFVNPARDQLDRKIMFSLFPFALENLVSRDGFSRPVPRKPTQ